MHSLGLSEMLYGISKGVRETALPLDTILITSPVYLRLLGMKERWKDAQREKGKETVIITLSEQNRVQGEARILQITALCSAVGNPE